MVARFTANVSENCSEADNGRQWGQQREIQDPESLLVQLSRYMRQKVPTIQRLYYHPIKTLAKEQYEILQMRQHVVKLNIS